MKGLKNPLAQLFGVLLQKMRTDMGVSSDEVAHKMGLGGSSYRMVEAGSATYQPGRALELIQVFPEIEFDPLCRLLVAIQTIENNKKSWKSKRETADLLSEADPQLKLVLDAIAPAWLISEKNGSHQVITFFEEIHAEHVLRDFLTTNRYFGVAQEKRLDFELNALIEEIPSVYLDFILDSLHNLRKYRLHYFPNESSSWESENKHNFTNLYAIISDPTEITKPDNFRAFDYNYLWQSQFQQLHFILLGENTNAAEQQRAFKENLRLVLREKSTKYAQELETFDEVLDKKVKFKSGQAYAETLSALMEAAGEQGTQIFWVFTLKNGNNIGFVSNNSMQQVFYGTALTYKQTRDKLEEFKKIWNDLAE